MSRESTKRPSPVLGAASAMINEASGNLISKASRFRHSFEVEVETIRPDPNQPRKLFTDQDISLLASTMEERGQLQPILLRRDETAVGHWIIVAGERRWRAAKLNGWPSILAIEHDGDPEVASLLENLQRVDLSPVEEARGLQSLIEGKGWSQDQAARAIGKSKSEISGVLRILTLPSDLLERVLTSELNLPKNTLVELARIEDSTVRERLINSAREGGLTVKAIRASKNGLQEPSGETSVLRGAASKTGPTGSGIHLRRLDQLIAALRAAQESGRLVSVHQRRLLECLRIEIDRLIGARNT